MERQEIYDRVMKCGSNSVSVFGGEFEGGYQLQQNPPEITGFLYDMQQREYANYLEIGVAAAGLTRIICDCLKVGNVYTMDLGEHPSIPAAYAENIANLKNSGKTEHFRGDSHSEAAKGWLTSLGVKFDFAFIDGDHSYQGVKLDTLLTVPFMNSGGIVAFHDQACVGEIGQWVKEMRDGAVPGLVYGKEYIGDERRKGIVWFEVRK